MDEEHLVAAGVLEGLIVASGVDRITTKRAQQLIRTVAVSVL
jgi:hypothetical protein